MSALDGIWGGNYVHPYINARDSILKICDRIRQAQNKWKGAELLAKSMGQGFHKLFKAALN